jgi:type IV pilus assembly protein PilC
LPGSFAVVADQMERMYLLKKKIKGALMYPSIILIAMLGIGAYMMVSVVPTLAATFKEMKVDLPLSTQTIMWLSDFLVNNLVASAIGLVVFILMWPIAARTDAGKRTIDWVLLHTPVIKDIVRELNAARTGRTLASLLTSGVDILTSLEITHEVVQNTYFRDVIKDAQRGVGQGEPLSVSFTRREDLYPAFVGEMMAVGEETGQTNEMLKRLALYYEDEVDRKTKDMSTIIEPFLMVFIGGAVGFFAVSMITPIYQISQNM